jgi:hypothetical protein
MEIYNNLEKKKEELKQVAKKYNFQLSKNDLLMIENRV